MATLYFRIIKERQDYLGERYFKANFEDDYVVQVMAKKGNTGGKGQKQNIGVYLISKITFVGNYMAVNSITATTKTVYEKMFDEVSKMIK